MPVILNTKFIYKSSTQLGIKSTAVTSLIGNTAGITFIGGTATTADLSLQTTSGVGTTGADMHFLVGNAGGTEAMTILNSGFVGIGTTSPGAKLEIGSGQIFMPNGTAAAPSLSFTSGTASGLFSPAAQLVSMSIAGTERVRFTGTEIEMSTLALTWGATFNADDVGLSRGAANKLYVGNGTNGDYSGTLIAGNVGIGTADPGSAKLAIMNGNVGIGTTGPTNLLSLGGNAARIFWLERHTTADTAGNTLTITAGGATSGATDKAGGALILQGGLSTGSAESGVTIQGVVAGASGTADRTQTTAIQVLGNKLAFFAQTPVVRQTELTDELTTITFSNPGTPDYAIQDLVQNTGFGFVTADEGQTVLSVIANLQARVNELETKLTAYGLLIDAD